MTCKRIIKYKPQLWAYSGLHQIVQVRTVSSTSSSGLLCGTSATFNGVVSWNWYILFMIHYCFFLELVFSLCAPCNISSTLSNQDKWVTQDKLAEMPSCNLAESIHNKWLQASGNKDGNLYVATVDDFFAPFYKLLHTTNSLKVELAEMVQAKKNWSSRLLNVELNVLAILQCCKRSCLLCPVGKSFTLAMHTLRSPRCLDRKSKDRTLQLVMVARPTAPILWTSHALAG